MTLNDRLVFFQSMLSWIFRHYFSFNYCYHSVQSIKLQSHLHMKNNLRIKTDLYTKTPHGKSTEFTEQPQQPELQECKRELLKHLHKDSLNQNLLLQLLHRLALSPADLLPLSREQVARMSKKQTKQLFKEDIDYYLDNKCNKLEARRQGILVEVARQYEQTEKAHDLASKFASHLKTDTEVTKRRGERRYSEVEDSQNLIKRQEKRIKILKKLKIKEISQRDLRDKALDNFTRKFSLAESRRESYRQYVESLRSSPVMSPEQHKQKMDDLNSSQIKRCEQLKEQLIVKLQRATKSRAQKKRQTNSAIHERNQQTTQKIKTIRQTSRMVEQQFTKMLDTQIQQDIQVHIKKRNEISDKHVKNLHKKRQSEEKKVLRIKEELKKKEEEQQEKQIKLLQEKEVHAERNKINIRERMEQLVREKQKARDLRIGDIYRKKSLVDMDGQQRRRSLLRYRLETQAMVSQRKHSMQVQKRRKHIIEQIKGEISALNVKRHHKMQEIKIQQTKEQLQIVDHKRKELQNKKQHMTQNRQKLKMVFLRRRHNLDMYFDSKARDFKSLSVNINNSFLTSPLCRSIDVEEVQKTRKFNMSIDR